MVISNLQSYQSDYQKNLDILRQNELNIQKSRRSIQRQYSQSQGDSRVVGQLKRSRRDLQQQTLQTKSGLSSLRQQNPALLYSKQQEQLKNLISSTKKSVERYDERGDKAEGDQRKKYGYRERGYEKQLDILQKQYKLLQDNPDLINVSSLLSYAKDVRKEYVDRKEDKLDRKNQQIKVGLRNVEGNVLYKRDSVSIGGVKYIGLRNPITNEFIPDSKQFDTSSGKTDHDKVKRFQQDIKAVSKLKGTKYIVRDPFSKNLVISSSKKFIDTKVRKFEKSMIYAGHKKREQEALKSGANVQFMSGSFGKYDYKEPVVSVSSVKDFNLKPDKLGVKDVTKLSSSFFDVNKDSLMDTSQITDIRKIGVIESKPYSTSFNIDPREWDYSILTSSFKGAAKIIESAPTIKLSPVVQDGKNLGYSKLSLEFKTKGGKEYIKDKDIQSLGLDLLTGIIPVSNRGTRFLAEEGLAKLSFKELPKYSSKVRSFKIGTMNVLQKAKSPQLIGVGLIRGSHYGVVGALQTEKFLGATISSPTRKEKDLLSKYKLTKEDVFVELQKAESLIESQKPLTDVGTTAETFLLDNPLTSTVKGEARELFKREFVKPKFEDSEILSVVNIAEKQRVSKGGGLIGGGLGVEVASESLGRISLRAFSKVNTGVFKKKSFEKIYTKNIGLTTGSLGISEGIVGYGLESYSKGLSITPESLLFSGTFGGISAGTLGKSIAEVEVSQIKLSPFKKSVLGSEKLVSDLPKYSFGSELDSFVKSPKISFGDVSVTKYKDLRKGKDILTVGSDIVSEKLSIVDNINLRRQNILKLSLKKETSELDFAESLTFGKFKSLDTSSRVLTQRFREESDKNLLSFSKQFKVIQDQDKRLMDDVNKLKSKYMSDSFRKVADLKGSLTKNIVIPKLKAQELGINLQNKFIKGKNVIKGLDRNIKLSALKGFGYGVDILEKPGDLLTDVFEKRLVKKGVPVITPQITFRGGKTVFTDSKSKSKLLDPKSSFGLATVGVSLIDDSVSLIKVSTLQETGSFVDVGVSEFVNVDTNVGTNVNVGVGVGTNVNVDVGVGVGTNVETNVDTNVEANVNVFTSGLPFPRLPELRMKSKVQNQRLYQAYSQRNNGKLKKLPFRPLPINRAIARGQNAVDFGVANRLILKSRGMAKVRDSVTSGKKGFKFKASHTGKNLRWNEKSKYVKDSFFEKQGFKGIGGHLI